MSKDAKIIAQYADEGESVRVDYEGNVSYQDALSFAMSILMMSVDGFKKYMMDEMSEEEREAYLGVMYDDLNIRFSNMLDYVIPEEELPVDFTEEAINALETEDIYIDLKFKAMQYEKIVEKIEETGRDYAKVTLEENGEFKV